MPALVAQKHKWKEDSHQNLNKNALCPNILELNR